MADTHKTDGTYDFLDTPLSVPKASADPQADLDNAIIPGAKGQLRNDPNGFLTGLEPTSRRGGRG